MKLSVGQRGDTIVEVLIAIAVVGSVMAVSYSIMSRNLGIMRDNQERTEAAKLAQGQLETLKAMWQTVAGQTALDAQGVGGFCIDSGGNLVTLSGGSPTADPGTDDLEAYNSACVVNSIHRVGIRREGPAGNYSYRVFVRWDQIGTGVTNQAVLVYRLD